MTYGGWVKRLHVHPGWSARKVLHYERIRAEAISRDHLDDDVQGINASIELIRRTRAGPWPTGPVTRDLDYVDLVAMNLAGPPRPRHFTKTQAPR